MATRSKKFKSKGFGGSSPKLTTPKTVSKKSKKVPKIGRTLTRKKR